MKFGFYADIWLRRCATIRMVVGSTPCEVIEFILMYLILPAPLGLGVHSASNRNEYQKQTKMFVGSRARPMRRTDNLIAICEAII
jgi:hypothetical protein